MEVKKNSLQLCYGFKKNSFINTVTSGEMIWQLLKKEFLDDKNKKNCFHISNILN